MVAILISWFMVFVSFGATSILIGTDTCIYSSTGDNKISINDYCGRDFGTIDLDKNPVDAALWNHWLIVTLGTHSQGIPVIDTRTQKIDHYLPGNAAESITVKGDFAYIAHPAGTIHVMNLTDSTSVEFLTIGSGMQFLDYKGNYLVVGMKKKVLVYDMQFTPTLHCIFEEDHEIAHSLHKGQELRYIFCVRDTMGNKRWFLAVCNLQAGKKILQANLGENLDTLDVSCGLLGLETDLEKEFAKAGSTLDSIQDVSLEFLSHFDWILARISAESLGIKGDSELTKAMLARKETKLSLNGIECCAFIMGLESSQRERVLASPIWQKHRLRLLRNLVPGVFISESYCERVLTGLLQLGDPLVTNAWKIRSESAAQFTAYPKVLTIPVPATSSVKQHTD